MQLDFNALEKALAPVAEIGQGETTFDAGDTTITLRVLLPSEEVAAQKYAATALNQDDEGDHQAVDYLDRLRIGMLAYAVVAIGDNNFRGIEYIETGEKLEGGTAIKMTKAAAMQKLIGRWSRTTLTNVFGKFHDLVQKAEAEAENQIEYEPSNISAEIDRLQNRVIELRAEQDKVKAAEQAKLSERLASVDQRPSKQPPLSTEPLPDPTVPSPVLGRMPIAPTTVQTPVKNPHQNPHQEAREVQAQVVAHTPRPDSSFIDTSNDETLDDALDSEHRRLAEMRRGRAPDQGSALSATGMHSGGRRAPHRDAREAEEDTGFAHRSAQHRGTTEDGVPVFAMPSQELGAQPPVVQAGPSRLNPPAPAGSTNPRFRSPKKP